MKNYIGIDPGKDGGMVLLDENGDVCQTVGFRDMTETDICVTLREWADSDPDAIACIEAVHSMPAQGVASSFAFGQSYGFLRGVLTGVGLQWSAVSPVKWKKQFGLIVKGSKDTPKTEKKNLDKAAAQRRWPDCTWTHATADAALIAEFIRVTQR